MHICYSDGRSCPGTTLGCRTPVHQDQTGSHHNAYGGSLPWSGERPYRHLYYFIITIHTLQASFFNLAYAEPSIYSILEKKAYSRAKTLVRCLAISLGALCFCKAKWLLIRYCLLRCLNFARRGLPSSIKNQEQDIKSKLGPCKTSFAKTVSPLPTPNM